MFASRSKTMSRSKTIKNDAQQNKPTPSSSIRPSSPSPSASASGGTSDECDGLGVGETLAPEIINLRQLLERGDKMSIMGSDFTAAIEAYGRAHEWMHALCLLKFMEENAVHRFQLSPADRAVAKNATIAACARATQWELALDMIRSMRTEQNETDVGTGAGGGGRSNIVTLGSYTQTIVACGKARAWERALCLFREMKEEGIQSADVVCYNALINAVAKGGLWEKAIRLVEEMKSTIQTVPHLSTYRPLSPDVVSYTGAISACADKGQWEPALRLLRECQSTTTGLVADVKAYNAAISACEKAGAWEQGVALLECMQRNPKVMPSVESYSAVISALGKGGQWQQAVRLLESMKGRSTTRTDTATHTHPQEQNTAPRNSKKITRTLPPSCASCTSCDGCKGINDYHDFVAPNVVTYNATMSACARAGEWVMAMKLLEELRNNINNRSEKKANFLNRSLKPTVVSYATCIRACEVKGQWREAMTVFQQMKAAGIAPNAIVLTSLIGVLMNTTTSDDYHYHHLPLAVQVYTREARSLFPNPWKRGNNKNNPNSQRSSSSSSSTSHLPLIGDFHGFPPSVALVALYVGMHELAEKAGGEEIVMDVVLIVGRGRHSGKGEELKLKPTLLGALEEGAKRGQSEGSWHAGLFSPPFEVRLDEPREPGKIYLTRESVNRWMREKTSAV